MGEVRFSTVTVLYGTDRARDYSKMGSFGGERGHKLSLGSIRITIPAKHKPGMVEEPITVFSVSLPRDPQRHFTIRGPHREMNTAEFIKESMKTKNIDQTPILFIHGYRNSFSDGAYRAAQLAYDTCIVSVSDCKTRPVFYYSWPSRDQLFSYDYDVDSAEQSEEYFIEFIRILMIKSGLKNINIIAHSRGNSLVLNTLSRMKERGDLRGKCCGQLILASPDVDADIARQKIKNISNLFNGITLYANNNDLALAISRRKAGGKPRAGHLIDGNAPLIVRGMDSIDGGSGAEILGVNHDTYVTSTPLLRDVEALIARGVRPPSLRTPTLRTVPTKHGQFWRLEGE
jgi:esterase/lipase superfamily enzyme